MIPFTKPNYSVLEQKYARDAVLKGQISGDGFYTHLASDFMELTFHTKRALLTTSCSSALDMAGILLDLKEGDEVIMPSYTFVSTANAVVMRGAKPVFIDIDEKTLNMDPNLIEKRITERTQAIIPVHYAGISCDLDQVLQVAKKYHLKVVEDAAQGVNARYKGKYLGTIGEIGCYSFHDTKNYTCGEGGAILINDSDGDLIARAEIIREKGTNRSQFFRGEVDKYTWVDVGSSFLPSDISAAILYAQFQKLDEVQEKRRKVYFTYEANLKELANQGRLRLPYLPDYNDSNYHNFYILLPSEEERNGLMAKLKSDGITAIFHYLPLHTSPMGIRMGYKAGELPVTESISGRILRLPMFVGLLKKEQEYIVDRIYFHLGEKRRLNKPLRATG